MCLIQILEKRKNIYTSVYGRLGNYYLNGEGKNVAKAKEYFEKFYQLSPSDELRTFIDGLKVE